MTANPMRKALAALALHPRCGAHCRTTGRPCPSPAMANGRCRMHGGKSPGAPRGKAHPNYKHGERSSGVIADRRATRALVRSVLALIEQAETGIATLREPQGKECAK
jgi:hypothetical protein